MCSHPLERGAPPSWATTWGQDVFGVFAGFHVDGVECRLRWIPGGRFVMGSPDDESGRWNDETAHDVEVSGFWLGEVPVTQELWQAVMGSNPSEFPSPSRPVENVNWEESCEMVERLNGREAGLSLRLPTEAEWEYACRAGTTTATYAGDLEILGERNAPVLDAIAWYGGNSGVDFDLEKGRNTTGWSEKQYENAQAGTRLVRGKRPNDLGLYDMLGNVWEWCQDWFGNYPAEFAWDPRGPGRGGNRVLRGGSWDDIARRVRAAFRLHCSPGFRRALIGFRLAQGP